MWLTSKEFRKKYNISPQYLYALKKNNKITTKPYIGSTYLILDPLEDKDIISDTRDICIYARVSTTKQKTDLDNQISYLKKYLISHGINPTRIYKDIGSGMNENRNGLNDMIQDIIDGKISKVVISHKDRLTRFGFGYLENVFMKFNTIIEVVNLEDDKDFQTELTEDLIAIIHHFSMRFYGKLKNKCSELEKNAILLKNNEDK